MSVLRQVLDDCWLAAVAESPGLRGMLCYVCLMIELTFAHANTVWSLKFFNEPSSGKHRMECYEC